MIRFTTNLGVIDIELDPEHAPITLSLIHISEPTRP